MVAGLGAVAVGGIVIAVTRGGSDPASPEPVAVIQQVPAAIVEPSPTPVSPPPVIAVKPLPAPEKYAPTAEVALRTKDILNRFVAWARDHRGAPCPDIAVLGDLPRDPWAHAFQLTCTNQPSDQIVGVISIGPDSKAGTPDDITSWQLGHDVTDSVRGARWVAAEPPIPSQAKTDFGPNSDTQRMPLPSTTKPVEARPPDATTKSKQDLPSGRIKLDEFGIPFKRKR